MVAMVNLDGEDLVRKSPHSIDAVLSTELTELSVKDRNAIDEEFHGVSSCAAKETPELLENSLLEMSMQLDRITDTDPSKFAYLKSQTNTDTYVNTKEFRLRFLRCEFFDAKKAAIRLLKFLTLVLDVVGPVALQRPFRITDMTKEEQKQMQLGYLQIFPYRDRSGRPICTWCGDFGVEAGTFRSRTRILLYLWTSMSEDVESQRKGITKIAWMVGCKDFVGKIPDWKNAEIHANLCASIPIRISCNHFCLPDKPFFHVLRSMFSLAYCRMKSIARVKFHIGEEVEILYTLKTYGIPVELIPVTGTGNIKTTYIRQWMKMRKNLENMRKKGAAETIITCPGSTDVIFRTGKALTSHPGNSMFQNIIESKMEEHASAKKSRKTEITRDIIRIVKGKGGRFLKWDPGGWWTEIVDATLIHKKVAVSMKDFKLKMGARKNRQTSSSSTMAFRNQDGKRQKISKDGCYRILFSMPGDGKDLLDGVDEKENTCGPFFSFPPHQSDGIRDRSASTTAISDLSVVSVSD